MVLGRRDTSRRKTPVPARFNPPCSGTIIWSVDLSSGSFEVTCPEDDFGAGYTNLQVSEFIFSPDARRFVLHCG